MRITSLAVVLCVATLIGCGTSSIKPTKDSQGRVPVVATNSILADWVKQIGGDQVQVTTLVPADGDPHAFEPTPRDGVALTKAMLVFENGLQFEAWLDELFESSGSLAVRVAVSRDITPRKVICACHGSSEDPHVFQSVKHAISMVQVIAEELSRVDPDHAELYASRSQAYVKELENLDHEIRSLVAEIPEKNRLIVTAHNTFGYFAEDYGFEVLSLLDSVTSEASDPSAMKFGSLIRRIQEQKIPALFVESATTSKLVQQVARESAVRTVQTLNSDSLGAEDTPAGTYVGMMRTNAKKIAESLR